MGNIVSVASTSYELGEANDCVVKAFALAMDISYLWAHELCAAYGRKNNKGMIKMAFISLVEHFMETNYLIIEKNKYSSNTIGDILDKNKTYILMFKEHVATFVNGDVEDYDEYKSLPIMSVIEVTPKDAPYCVA